MIVYNKGYVRRIVFYYVVFASSWIFFTDTLFSYIFPTDFSYFSVLKGFFFVLTTAFLLKYLLSKFLRQIYLQHSEKDKALEELKKLKDDLEYKVLERTNDLKESNETLEAFAYSVSHDLKAPLRAVTGFSKILEEEYSDKLDDEGKRIINVIKDNVSKMDTLINDILTLSRVQRVKVDFSKIDTKHLVRDILEQLANLYDLKRYTIDIGEISDCMGDPTLIRQVFYNIIENALKYSSKSENPKITIDSFLEDDFVVYRIMDNGVGFDSQYKDKLFILFSRLHSSQEFSGIGVGLAIVKTIIQRHKGKIWAEGEKGRGATFFIKLKRG